MSEYESVTKTPLRLKKDSGIKKFHVVKFQEDNSVTVVPSSWVFKDMCAWPPLKSPKLIENYVKSLRGPEPLWQRIKVVVMESSDFYDRAVELEKTALLTSDLNGESEEFSRRKRKHPKRFDSSEEEILTLPPLPKQRKPYGPTKSHRPLVEGFSSESESATPTRSGNRQEKNKDENFRRSILQLLESLSQEVREIKEVLRDGTLKGAIPALPVDCPQLPCEDPNDLVALECLLKDEKIFDNICEVLGSTGGSSIKDCTKRVLGKLLSTKLSLQYNWKGTRGLKLGFSALNLINQLIFGAVRKNPLCATATEKDVQDVTKNWLMHARDREGGRNERK